VDLVIVIGVLGVALGLGIWIGIEIRDLRWRKR